jgi:hypothetical protein
MEMEDMKRSVPVLVLFALLALIPAVPSLAETSASAAPAAPTLLSVDEFLETLVSPSPALEKAALSTSTSCTVTGCPTGYKCCYPCGIPDCEWVCMQVRRCPLIP